ncbi:MAG TPA: hypothetical protein VIV60_08570, partial [Polyangiaceae bacterium]
MKKLSKLLTEARTRSQGESMTDVGTIGEKQFGLWCEQAGLTATPPSQDRYGWDFVVQFPHLDPSAPIDKRPPQLKCMVQVKSTSRAQRRARIKLDNWERMVNDPLPWFVCALAFDNGSVAELVLVHIDEKHTERILKRPRSLRAKHSDADQRLHESTFDVSWGDRNAIVPPTPVALRDAMLVYMGKDPYGYGERKREWYQNVGYDKHPRTITAHLKGSSPEEVWRNV